MPGYAYHLDNAANELNNIKKEAYKYVNGRAPGAPPDAAVMAGQAAFVGAPENAVKSLVDVTNIIANDASLTAFYNYMTDLNNLAAIGDLSGGAMEAAVLFGALPAARKRHAETNIPVAVTKNTFNDLIIGLENYAVKNNGAFGIYFYRQWLHHHYNCELYRIGRLQYILKPYESYARVFADDATGEVVAAAQNGVRFRGDGLLDLEGKTEADGGYWLSETSRDGNIFTGNCLLVNGRAVRTPVKIDLNIRREAFAKGSYGLEMHIPRGAGLTRAGCIDSLREAWRFFHKLYPDTHFEAFFCGSWLLDNRMQHILPSGSGIVEFQKLFRLYPLPGSEWPFLDRVFGVDPTTVTDIKLFAQHADRDTSLRRGIADYWLAGGRLSPAGGVIHQYDLFKMDI